MNISVACLRMMGGVLALFLLGGCTTPSEAPVFTKGGKTYGTVEGTFRHRWWNYYERALSYADGEFYDYAVSDLQKALQGRDKDQRRARTYGMHFMDYFPHRELGVVYYFTGKLEAARGELEHSLKQHPSAKAQYYLDRVRKALIEKAGRVTPPPTIVMDSEQQEFWTREDSVTISGTVKDEAYVSGITIHGSPVFLEGTRKRVSFERSLSLSQGRHAVRVEARNLMGKISARQVIIHVDREGPVITVERIKAVDLPYPSVIAKGWVHDDTDVEAFSVNGEPVLVNAGTETPFATRIQTDSETLTFEAGDRLGNQTIARVPLQDTLQSSAPIRLALGGGRGIHSGFAALFGPKDEAPPEILLKGWADSQTVYLRKAFIEGQVLDTSKIVRLAVNKTPVIRREGRCIFFNHLVPLKKGPNTFLIEATDESGNTAAKELTIVRKIPEALQLAERLCVTVAPFEQNAALTLISSTYQDNLIHSLVRQDRFRIIERTRLDMILQEQNLSRTELIDRDTALRVGKLAAAHGMVTGSIMESRTGLEIVARFIDTETSEILSTVDVYDEAKDLSGLRGLAEGMALKFHRNFPLLSGMVIQTKGEHVITDLGKDKLGAQRRLILYRETPVKHPVTGKLLGEDNVILGFARITQIMPKMSKAAISSVKRGPIQGLDRVITQ